MDETIDVIVVVFSFFVGVFREQSTLRFIRGYLTAFFDNMVDILFKLYIYTLRVTLTEPNAINHCRVKPLPLVHSVRQPCCRTNGKLLL